MKKIVIWVGIAVVVLVAAVLVVVFLSLNTIVKKGVETVGPIVTKVDVKLGAAELSPFSGSGRLTKFVLGNPPGYQAPSSIMVGDIKLGVQLGSVASDVIVINEVNIKDAEIFVEGTLNDNNLTTIQKNMNGADSAQSKADATAATSSANKKPKKFIVKSLDMAGAKVHLDLSLPLLGRKTLSVTIPPIHLQNIGVAENGVTAGELVQDILKPLIQNIIAAATEEISKLTGSAKDIGKKGAEQLNNAVGGLSDLFKKKP